jgi:hypothetical protein
LGRDAGNGDHATAAIRAYGTELERSEKFGVLYRR